MQRVLTGRHIGWRTGEEKRREGRGAGRPKVCVRCGRDIGGPRRPPASKPRVPVIFGDRVIQRLYSLPRGIPRAEERREIAEAKLGDKDSLGYLTRGHRCERRANNDASYSLPLEM